MYNSFNNLCFIFRRNRRIQPGSSSFAVLSDSVKFDDGSISAKVINSNTNVTLSLIIDTLQENTARIRINEIDPIRPRHVVLESLVKEPSRAKYLSCTFLNTCWLFNYLIFYF